MPERLGVVWLTEPSRTDCWTSRKAISWPLDASREYVSLAIKVEAGVGLQTVAVGLFERHYSYR